MTNDGKALRVAMTIGWVLLTIGTVSAVAELATPHQRDPAIDSLLAHPDGRALAGTLGFLIGRNSPLLLSFLAGTSLLILRRYRRALPLVVLSTLVMLATSALEFRPASPTTTAALSTSRTDRQRDDHGSGSSAQAQQQSERQAVQPNPESYGSFVEVQNAVCEFAIRLPQEPTRSIGEAGSLQIDTFQCEGVASQSFFRVELIPLPNYEPGALDLSATLHNFAEQANIAAPSIRTWTDSLGVRGNYMGTKTAGGVKVKMQGEVVIGRSSMLHCFGIEPLAESPSLETLLVFGSIRKK